MFNLIFTNDIHLNFCSEDKIGIFCHDILQKKPSALVIGGDISESQTLAAHLMILCKHLNGLPIYFVMGNHDYYNGSIYETRGLITKHFGQNSKLNCKWLGSFNKPVKLTDTTALIGHDGWYDGEYANWFSSKLVMNDYRCIQELNNLTCPIPQLRFEAIQKLSLEAARFIEKQLEKAHEAGFDKLFVITHVAPFPEVSLYQGKISDQDWLPHFSSKKMGDMLLRTAEKYPRLSIIVLSGHTNGEAYFKPLNNLECYAGEAFYGLPGADLMFKF